MAFDESTGGTPFTMPVAPAYGMNNGGFGFGGDGSWAWIILLLLAFGGGWGNGFGGFGGNELYPWLNNSQNISGGFRDQMLNTQLSGVQNSITSGFGDVQTALCGGFAGVNAAVNGAQNAVSQQLYTNQLAELQQMFGLQSQLSQCCCDNRLATAQTQALVQSENCTDRYEAAQNTAAIINAITGGIQSIKDDLCADRLEAERRENANLRSELMFARGQASQDVQTAAIQAGQRALASEVEQYILPTPKPAYVVANPNCCQPYNCGCGVA